MGLITNIIAVDNTTVQVSVQDYGTDVGKYAIYADDVLIPIPSIISPQNPSGIYCGSGGTQSWKVPVGTKTVTAIGYDGGGGHCSPMGSEVNRMSVMMPTGTGTGTGTGGTGILTGKGDGTGTGTGNGNGSGMGRLLLLVGIAAGLIYLIGGKK